MSAKRECISLWILFSGVTRPCVISEVQESGGSIGSAVEKITARSQKSRPYPKWKEFSSRVTGSYSGGSGPWPKNACCLGGRYRQPAPQSGFRSNAANSRAEGRPLGQTPFRYR